MIFSAAGLAATWIVEPKFKALLLSLLDSLDSALATTDESLDALDEIVDVSISNMDTFETSMDDLSSTLESLSASLSDSADLIGDDLQLTISETQVALSSAATSAEIIDDTLAIIAAIPLIGADYQPDVPLHTSLEQTAASLEDIPESLEEIEQNLNATSASLDSLNADLESLAASVTDLDDELEQAALIVEDYQVIIDTISTKSTRIRDNLPLILIIGCSLISGIFFWLGFAQLMILMENKRILHGEKIVNLADIHRE